ncbi:cell shape-determining protein, partial [Bradyrhizobium sp. UFLA 03-164]|nr:cell shape-determining protein [Bradyrhizobium uaiense]
MISTTAEPAGAVAVIDVAELTVKLVAAVAPTVTLISPASGLAPGGTAVTITGTGFTGVTA